MAASRGTGRSILDLGMTASESAAAAVLMAVLPGFWKIPALQLSTPYRSFDFGNHLWQLAAMRITPRQGMLVLAVVACAAFDLWYFASRSRDNEKYVLAEWVAYMPALEKRQRDDESQLLYSSHHWDPAYPSPAIENGVPYPLLSKTAHSCRVREYAISQFVGPIQMPDRLFLGALEPIQVKCLQNELPKGYMLAKLSASVRPHSVGWAEGDLQINPHQE